MNIMFLKWFYTSFYTAKLLVFWNMLLTRGQESGGFQCSRKYLQNTLFWHTDYGEDNHENHMTIKTQ